MKLLTLLMLSMLYFTTNGLFAQNGTSDDTTRVLVVPPPPPPPYEGFDFDEQEPAYPGGDEAMQAFIKENITYPEEAKNNKEQGRVFVKFFVEKDGSITEISIVRGVSPSLDAEAIRIIELMPKWIPGEQFGRPVRFHVVVPIAFKL